MAKKTGGRATPRSPKSTANDIRRGAAAMRACVGGLKLHQAECRALVDWAERKGLILPFTHICEFRRVSSGAEHVVYHDQDRQRAVKVTHANQFGHSPYGEGYRATPVEYLNRMAWQNVLFGDDVLVEGVVADDDHIEIVTSQPWLQLHSERPHPFSHEIDFYFKESGFVRVHWAADVPLYFSNRLNLIAADAHDHNVVRDSKGRLMAIDVVIGRPGPEFQRLIDDCLYGPLLF